MKTRTKIIILMSFILVIFIIAINNLFEKKVQYVPEEQIEPQITSETTTSSTNTTTITKTTKKAIKTTKKTTQVKTTKKVVQPKSTATGSKAEYMQYAKEYGNLNDTQLACLDYLWSHESGWNPNSVNKSSGACGIPQAYPCKKIAQQQESNDWKAQIRWGINYINGRYKNPCGAWNHFKNHKPHWY